MATISPGGNSNSAMGWGQSANIVTTFNVYGRWYFTPSNSGTADSVGMAGNFGPQAINITVGPFDIPGTLTVENFNGSASTITFTINNYSATAGVFTTLSASSGVFTTLSASSTVSGAGFSTYLASPPNIGTTAPGIIKTSNLQTSYTDSSGTPGNATNNSPRGRAAFAAGFASVAITNSLVTASSSVFVQLETSDLTLLYTTLVAVGVGSFTVYGNVAATNATTFSFLVVN